MNIFKSIQVRKPKSNKFDLSHERKLSFNMADLVPIYLEEIVPGDKFRVNSDIFIRMAPMLAPIMHRVNVYTHYFFVPNRIVWDEWKDFITGGEDGTLAPNFPKMTITDGNKASFGVGTLSDYFGLPIPSGTIPAPISVNVLPFRGYQEIYNEYYRDQNLEPKIDFPKDGTIGPSVNLLSMRTRAWEKDYFTSALPWAQRGGDVTLPVSFQPKYLETAETIFPNDGGAISRDGSGNIVDTESTTTGLIGIKNLEDKQDGVAVTINELRTASRLQEWLEKNARGGSRYIEQILSHFGVRSSDARLQRPEYLGGGKNPVVISEVLNQTGELDPSEPVQYAPVGQQYGHGVALGKTNGFTKTFEEHGYIIGIMSVLPRTAYQQGIERTWRKFDKLDYYWPEFSHLGEQEIKESEIYADWTAGVPLPEEEQTFGYTPRYAEYKYKQSSVHGDFRQTGTDPAGINLSFWHMSRYFGNKPTLNEDFVKADPTRNIFAVTDPTQDTLYCQIFNKVSAIRPMPYYGTPYL